MGDECEGVFEAVHEMAWDRYGLNRPDSSMKKMPARVRNTPDYVTSNGFIECKGVGKDQLLKIKLEVFNCMMFWHNTWDLQLFIWDSHNKRYAYVPIGLLELLINEPTGGATLKHFDDPVPKAYFAVPLVQLQVEWKQPDMGLAA